MICIDMEPFRVVERIQVVVPGYELPSRDDLSEKFLPTKESALQSKIAVSLAEAEYVAVSLDVCTSAFMVRFLAAEETFMGSDFTAHTHLPSFTTGEPHSGFDPLGV